MNALDKRKLGYDNLINQHIEMHSCKYMFAHNCIVIIHFLQKLIIAIIENNSP